MGGSVKIYVIGSLKNEKVPLLAESIRALGHTVFDDWKAAHVEADQVMWAYEQKRGHSYKDALRGLSAQNQYQFDKRLLDMSDLAIVVMEAGRSAHLEAGYMAGLGKPVYVLFSEGYPSRMDIMYNLLTDFFENEEELLAELRRLDGREVGPKISGSSRTGFYVEQRPID